MAFDKEQFAGQVYLELLRGRPGTSPEALRREAIKQAEDFAESLKSLRPAKQSRGTVNV